VVSFTSRPLYLQGKSPWYPFDRRLVKAKLSLCTTKHQAMKTYWGWRYSTTHSWPRTRRRWVVSFSFTPQPLYPPLKSPLYALDRMLCRVPEPIWTRWRREKFPAPVGNRTPGVRPVASRYTYWATPASVSLLTAWCRILFEKLIVTQLAKNSLLSLWNPKVRVHKSPSLYPIPSQPNPVRPIYPYLP
jgi:hypothetical protein